MPSQFSQTKDGIIPNVSKPIAGASYKYLIKCGTQIFPGGQDSTHWSNTLSKRTNIERSLRFRAMIMLKLNFFKKFALEKQNCKP